MFRICTDTNDDNIIMRCGSPAVTNWPYFIFIDPLHRISNSINCLFVLKLIYICSSRQSLRTYNFISIISICLIELLASIVGALPTFCDRLQSHAFEHDTYIEMLYEQRQRIVLVQIYFRWIETARCICIEYRAEYTISAKMKEFLLPMY